MLRNLLAALALLLLTACGGSVTGSSSADVSPAPTDLPGFAALPSGGAQPWERVDARGYVVPPAPQRGAAAIAPTAYFQPGVERFAEVGNVTDNDETSVVVAGSHSLSGGIYRFPMGGVQPGAVAVDVNLHNVNGKRSQFWVGLSDYGRGVWDWSGPYDDGQLTKVVVAGSNSLSTTSTFFVAVAGTDDVAFDIVGVTVSPRDDADTTAPPVPTGLTATPVGGGFELAWNAVVAADLAGYRLHWSYSPFTAADGSGVNTLPALENTTRMTLPVPLVQREVWLALSAVDVNGNASALSPTLRSRPRHVAATLSLGLVSPDASLERGEPATLTASGAELYDFDTDGDGDYDITDATDGTAAVDTAQTGIIRPRVRAHSADGTAVAFGSVSLIVSGNQRPVAVATATPTTGVAPLAAALSGSGTDFDGSIVEYAWDFDGDGTYDELTQDAAHDYTAPGLYNAKLRVTDDQGAWDVDTVAVYVTDGVRIDALPGYAQPGQQVTLTATPNGAGLGYEWDLDGDGTYEVDSGAANSTNAVFSEAGNQAVGVQVTMADGSQQTGRTTVRVAGWMLRTDFVGSTSTGQHSSLAIVNGHPAIAYRKSLNSDLYYVRALDPEGRSWGTPVPIVEGPASDGSYPSLLVVAGLPAIAYQSSNAGGVLAYVRAADSDGATWGLPQIVDDPGDAVGYHASMQVVSGHPAIAYLNATDNDVTYVRALDPQGTDWALPITLVTANSDGAYTSLVVVNGHPAISHYDQTANRLAYCRATDANGSAWGPKINLGPNLPSPEVQNMVIVDGFPAIGYGDFGNAQARFIRALDVDGVNWPTQGKLIHSDGLTTGLAARLGVVSGLPVMVHSYQGQQQATYLSRAKNAQGTAWHEPEMILQGGGSFSSGLSSIVDHNGQLAVCIHDLQLGMSFGLLY
jgi:PKD repeat protein